ncbi:MAG: hypothetical protein IJ777_01785 [Clostridia bacterium]|nr:hypothetical protein [Clostridia bacterium]
MEENRENTQEDIKQEEETQAEVKEEKQEKVSNSFEVHKEELKKEATNTVNQVKDTFKQTDIKKDSKEAKGFFTSFCKNPLQKLKEVTADTNNKFLKIAIIILVIWLVAILLHNVIHIASVYLFGYLGSASYFFKHLFSNFLGIIKSLIAPVITIALLSGLIYGFQKGEKKSFLSIAISIVIAKIPVVIASVVNLLTLFGSSVTKLTSPFAGFCTVLSTVLLYFVTKDYVAEKEDNTFFWKFALIIGIFYAVKFVFSFLGIYL